MTTKQLLKKADRNTQRLNKLSNKLAVLKSDLSKIQIVNILKACPRCSKVLPLVGSWQHMFGTEAVCENCADPEVDPLFRVRYVNKSLPQQENK